MRNSEYIVIVYVYIFLCSITMYHSCKYLKCITVHAMMKIMVRAYIAVNYSYGIKKFTRVFQHLVLITALTEIESHLSLVGRKWTEQQMLSDWPLHSLLQLVYQIAVYLKCDKHIIRLDKQKKQYASKSNIILILCSVNKPIWFCILVK